MSFSLRQLARTRKQVRRLVPILRVLARHGFGHFVHRTGLQHLVPLRYSRRRPGDEMTAPRRVRIALQELGPTFIKFGQMLSTRGDLLPESYLVELRTLTEDVPPFDTAVARKIIADQLHRPIAELFSEFGEAPVASGSIGQVYYARLRDGPFDHAQGRPEGARMGGTPVAVKVKRPGVEKALMADLDLLEFAAPLANHIEELRPLRLPMVVDEFRRSVMREVDFVTEASYTAKIKEELAGDPRVCVPAVYWELTTSDVLTLERIAGVSLTKKAELAALKIDRKRLARDLVEIFLHQFFKAGLFHADPHSGNILVMPDGRIGLLDFGMAGRLGEELRAHLATSFIALTKKDLDVIADIYTEIGVVSPDSDVERLKRDLQETLDRYYGIPTRCLDVRRCFNDALRIARDHHILLPRDFVLLGKSFVTMAMMARELDPDFDLASVAKPYALSLAADKLSPGRVTQNVLREAWYIGQGLRRLPRDLRTLSRKLLDGSLQVTLHLREFEGMVRELDRATNRLAFSVVVTGIVVGSSILLHAKIHPYMSILPGWLGRVFATYMPETSALGLGGFLFAGILGMLLAVAIWRSGKL
jgi:ubiquinone biosynthesis protein